MLLTDFIDMLRDIYEDKAMRYGREGKCAGCYKPGLVLYDYNPVEFLGIYDQLMVKLCKECLEYFKKEDEEAVKTGMYRGLKI